MPNLSDAAAANLLATEAGSRAARLALVSQVAAIWFTLAADQEQLALAGREQTLKLVDLQVQVGAASDVDLHGARSLPAPGGVSVRLAGGTAGGAGGGRWGGRWGALGGADTARPGRA